MPATSTVSPTKNPMVDGVLSGTKWAVTRFTYSFPTSASHYGAGYGSGEPGKGFEAMNAAQQNAVRAILAQFSAVANVTFTAVTESSSRHADLRFAESDIVSTAWAYYPTTRAEGGDAWFNNSRNHFDAPVKGNYAYTAFLHEIGHALGLKHPHETSGAFPAMPSSYDSMNYTVMTYRSYTGAPATGYTNETWGYAQSLMMADVAALQHMYGANFKTNSGNTVYSFSATTGEMFVNGVGQGAPGGNQIFLTIWDGGGTDTYDFSNYATNLTVSLAPGTWSTLSSEQLAKLHYDGSKLAAGNVANALQYKGDPRSLIENATGGSGNDSITGNNAGNTLNGGLGNDILNGGKGPDTFFFNTALNSSTNVDKVVSYSTADDSIRLENAVFTALPATGTLTSSAFCVGAAAQDASDRIVYNPGSGAVLYDSDGTGANAAVQFAALSPGLNMTAAEFFIV